VQGSGVKPDSVETAAINLSFSSDLRINAVSACKDAQTADEYRKMADGGIVMAKKFAGEQMPKGVTEFLDGIKIAAKDNRLTAEVTVKVATFLPLAKEILGKDAKMQFGTPTKTIGVP
jgi:hypothetical protein